jgi:hypothetical protein
MCRNSVFQQLQVPESTRLRLDSKGFPVLRRKINRLAQLMCVVQERQILWRFSIAHLVRVTKYFCLWKRKARFWKPRLLHGPKSASSPAPEDIALRPGSTRPGIWRSCLAPNVRRAAIRYVGERASRRFPRYLAVWHIGDVLRGLIGVLFEYSPAGGLRAHTRTLRAGHAGREKQPHRGPRQYEKWFHLTLLASDTHCLSPLPGAVPVCSQLVFTIVD